MGSNGGSTFNRGINRGAGTSRGSYISQGNTFNVDTEYMGCNGALHLIAALIQVQVHQEVATDLRVTHLMWI